MDRMRAWLLLALIGTIWLLGLSSRDEARAQGAFVPVAPEQDSILPGTVTKKDPRVAPRDAYNLNPTDPYVPKNTPQPWATNDYFAIPVNNKGINLIQIVENAHLGPKNNPRGFWPRYLEGRLDQAMHELNYVLWMYPNHPRALHLLGMLARETKQPYIPIAYYEKALRLFPDRAYTHGEYGAYLVEIGETTQGILQLEQALRMDPNLLTARAWLDKAKRSVGLDVGLTNPSAGDAQPTQQDGMYVPRR
ncbi:MAG: hypothetical protein ACM3PF_03475 [Bacteroidota bacterium]